MRWVRQPSLAMESQFKLTDDTDIIDTELAVGTGLSIAVYDGTIWNGTVHNLKNESRISECNFIAINFSNSGWMLYHHSGMLAPFTSRMSFYPALKLGIFSVANGPTDVHVNEYNHDHLQKAIFNLLRGGF
jgi:hypothetical protein